METQSKAPRVVVGVVMAVMVAAAMMVSFKPSESIEGQRDAATAQREERPIPASPWTGEVAGVAHGDATGLGFASDATIAQSASDIEAANAAFDVGHAVTPRVVDAMQTMRIDGSSLDAMVDSINTITSSLPEDDARAFQKAVRILMVASLPIEQMRAQKIAVDKLPPERLIAGAQKVLAGRTPLEVLKIAQARINAELAKRANGYGLGNNQPVTEGRITQ
ncbi:MULTISPECIES: DUF6694 family lipoprotein [unclassified Rhodanobacter]|uniref:DUF6694 family lipoprotein n=1 Tax=unclassified Rhodanobacter TaxID=2621553 RepID=UPI000AF19015|nr:DUF6694 family lipoprotein [Rhodanobacter sp. FW510-R10]